MPIFMVLNRFQNSTRHLLIVFGGLGGLEDAVEQDPSVQTTDPSTLFQLYINCCVNQGSRTIRTEVLNQQIVWDVCAV